MGYLETHAARLVLRDLKRTAAIGLGIALGAALLTSVVMFGTASGSTVTRRALAGVPVDAQVLLAPVADPQAAAATVASDPAVATILPFELVAFDTAAAAKSGTATQTSAGVLIAADQAYTTTTGLFPVIQGALSPGLIAVSRDLATNLGVVPGDGIAFTLPGGGTTNLVIGGIIDTAGADLVLGPTDAAHRAAGTNPPTNVALTDRATLDAVAALVPSDAVPAPPPGQQAQPGSPVVNADPAVRRELHVRYDHAQLPGDPTAAQQWLDGVRHRIEIQGAGAFSVVDDAAAALEPVASDLLWGQVLFVFLALPGVLLALAISRLAADATGEATRRHIALLRARGASRRQIARVMLESAAAVSLTAAVVGSVGGAVVAWLLFGPTFAGIDALSTALVAVSLSVLLVTVLATIVAALPLREQIRGELAVERQEIKRSATPFWQRYYLDLMALGAAAVVFVLTGGTGIHPVFNAEGNPTVTLALTSFLAPLLLWVGATLLLLRIASALLARSGGAAGVLRRLLGPGGELAARSLQARAPAAARTVVLLALTTSFATSLLVFNATYQQQQRIDAELTLGADLKLTPVATADATTVETVQGSGVLAATPFVDRIVYVGTEAQDLLAIDPATLPQAAPLADTFFDGATADQAMQALAAQPDAILVSSETAHDYSIVPGDMLRIRVPDAQGNLVTVTFHMAGIALEFPTAPKDAFLVANQSYVASETGNNTISYVLARAAGEVSAASHVLSARLGAGWQVTDLDTTSARLVNAVTSVDLAVLITLDLVFAVLIGALGSALFLLAELSARRRELATMEAIGAQPAQVRNAIAGEVAVMGVTGVLIGLIVGGLLGFTLLQTLAGLFDPPAQLPALPVAAILGFVGAVVLGLFGAIVVATAALRRLAVLSALRER
ncbi:MAG: ABC transporter permease [Chloroflexota bacterium]